MGLLEPSDHDWTGVEAHLSTLADRLMADHHLIDLPPARSGGELRLNRWKPVINQKLDPKTSKLNIKGFEDVEISLPLAMLDQIYEIAQEQGVYANQVVVGILNGVLTSGVLKPGWAIKHIG